MSNVYVNIFSDDALFCFSNTKWINHYLHNLFNVTPSNGQCPPYTITVRRSEHVYVFMCRHVRLYLRACMNVYMYMCIDDILS